MKPSRHSFPVIFSAVVSFVALSVLGCGKLPGKPGPEPEVARPDHVLDFDTLYKQNCVACHGDQKNPGPAIWLANPVYLATAGEGNIVEVLEHGRPGGLMPAFAQSGGGMLTDRQVQVLAKGMIAAWGKPDALSGMAAPTYKALLKADPAAGRKVFATYCASCHGANGDGAGGDVKGSIIDPAFLALVSDQNLRSIVIAGMNPDMPNFHDQDPAHPLTDQNVTDVVAWVASHRTALAGAPLSEAAAPIPAPARKTKHETSSPQEMKP